MTDKIFKNDAELFAEIKANYKGVFVRYNREWECYQLTTDTKHWRPDYDGMSLTEFQKPQYDKEGTIEARREVLWAALHMHGDLNDEVR